MITKEDGVWKIIDEPPCWVLSLTEGGGRYISTYYHDGNGWGQYASEQIVTFSTAEDVDAYLRQNGITRVEYESPNIYGRREEDNSNG